MFQPINLVIDCLKFGALTQHTNNSMLESIGGKSSKKNFTRLRMGTEATALGAYSLSIDLITTRSVLDRSAPCALYPGFTELMAQWGPWDLKWWNRHRQAISIRSGSSFVKASSDSSEGLGTYSHGKLLARTSWALLRRGGMQAHYWCHHKLIDILLSSSWISCLEINCTKLDARLGMRPAILNLCHRIPTASPCDIPGCLFVSISCGSWHLKLVTRVQEAIVGTPCATESGTFEGIRRRAFEDR